MNTFFQTAFYLCLGLILFNVSFSLVAATDAFPTNVETVGQDIEDESDALEAFTGLDNPSMNFIWAAATAFSGIAAIGLAWITHSITPVGIWLFGEIFWTSWLHTQSILGLGDYVGPEFIAIITVVMVFLFIATIIGMLTGSG